ncbi:ENR1 protein, partial [Ifrita kowaldi]|nr:ENR1 protein [Ifrita kowaldi]
LKFLELGKNLFVDLSERISRELNLTNCWVCGGTHMAEVWPWRGNSLDPGELLKWNHTTQREKDRAGGWTRSTPVIGEEYLWCLGEKFVEEVGDTSCKRYLATNGTPTWWIPKEPEVFWALKTKGRKC